MRARARRARRSAQHVTACRDPNACRCPSARPGRLGCAPHTRVCAPPTPRRAARDTRMRARQRRAPHTRECTRSRLAPRAKHTRHLLPRSQPRLLAPDRSLLQPDHTRARHRSCSPRSPLTEEPRPAAAAGRVRRAPFPPFFRYRQASLHPVHERSDRARVDACERERRPAARRRRAGEERGVRLLALAQGSSCLLYTSPSPRD